MLAVRGRNAISWDSAAYFCIRSEQDQTCQWCSRTLDVLARNVQHTGYSYAKQEPAAHRALGWRVAVPASGVVIASNAATGNWRQATWNRGARNLQSALFLRKPSPRSQSMRRASGPVQVSPSSSSQKRSHGSSASSMSERSSSESVS